jgi:hypothetical protein
MLRVFEQHRHLESKPTELGTPKAPRPLSPTPPYFLPLLCRKRRAGDQGFALDPVLRRKKMSILLYVKDDNVTIFHTIVHEN